MKFIELQKKYPQFVYDKYNYKIKGKDLEISFIFNVTPDIKFSPKIIIENINKSRIKKIRESTLDNLIFHLGLIEMISYWKATCSPKIIIKAAALKNKALCVQIYICYWYANIRIFNIITFSYDDKKLDQRSYQCLAEYDNVFFFFSPMGLIICTQKSINRISEALKIN